MSCGSGHLDFFDVLIGIRHSIDYHGPARECAASLVQFHICLVVLDGERHDVAFRHFGLESRFQTGKSRRVNACHVRLISYQHNLVMHFGGLSIGLSLANLLVPPPDGERANGEVARPAAARTTPTRNRLPHSVHEHTLTRILILTENRLSRQTTQTALYPYLYPTNCPVPIRT